MAVAEIIIATNSSEQQVDDVTDRVQHARWIVGSNQHDMQLNSKQANLF